MDYADNMNGTFDENDVIKDSQIQECKHECREQLPK